MNTNAEMAMLLCRAGILQEAMGRGEYWRLIDSQGRPPGLLGMWPSRAVTFVENHDTGACRTCTTCHAHLVQLLVIQRDAWRSSKQQSRT